MREIRQIPIQAISLLKKLGKDYFIKDDLKKYLKETTDGK